MENWKPKAGQLIGKLNIEFDNFFTSKLKRAINSLEINFRNFKK